MALSVANDDGHSYSVLTVTSQRRPVSILVVVYTDDDNVLLLRRRRPFEFWQAVTGSLAADELPCDAARRELCEETGLKEEGELFDAGVSRQFTIDPRWRNNKTLSSSTLTMTMSCCCGGAGHLNSGKQ